MYICFLGKFHLDSEFYVSEFYFFFFFYKCQTQLTYVQ